MRKLTGSFWVLAALDSSAGSCALSELTATAATRAVANSATATAAAAAALPCRRVGGGAAPHSPVDPSATGAAVTGARWVLRPPGRARRQIYTGGRARCTLRVRDRWHAALSPPQRSLLTWARRSQHEGSCRRDALFFFLAPLFSSQDCRPGRSAAASKDQKAAAAAVAHWQAQASRRANFSGPRLYRL